LLDLESDPAGHAALFASLRLYADLGGRGNESRADDAERTGYGLLKKIQKTRKTLDRYQNDDKPDNRTQ
jgi:hypothetical protein